MPTRQLIRQLRFASGQAEQTTLLFGRITRRLARWLDEFRPQIMFSQLGSLPMGSITLQIRRKYRLPFVLHVSDDWMMDWPANVLGRRYFPITDVANWRMRRLFEEAVRTSELRFGISDEMCREYERRFGLSFETLHNGVDLTNAQELLVHPEPFRIVYSGSVFRYGQYESLIDARDAVLLLRNRGMPLTLEIFTQHADDEDLQAELSRPPAVVVRRLVPPEDLLRNLRAAAALLLPANFDATSIRFLRLSLPGKLAEYLAAERPVVAYGPDVLAQTRFLRAWGCAELVEQRGVGPLAAAMERVLKDEARASQLMERAAETVRAVFDLRRIRSGFESRLRELDPPTLAA
jgi:glycosyltransferase involved in cell wall biosynthesis